jgi:hypothetical protein
LKRKGTKTTKSERDDTIKKKAKVGF